MIIEDKIYQKLKANSPEIAREVLNFLEFLELKAARTPTTSPPSFEPYFGTLRSTHAFQGDPREIQHKLREDWAG